MEPYEKDVKLKTKQNRNPISFTNLAKCYVLECAGNGTENTIYNIQHTAAAEPHNDFYFL